jgi:indolepyruvate decarboxylase
LKPARTLSDPDGLAQSIEKMAEKLRTAERPLLWIGVEVDRLGLQEKTARLIAGLKIPYVTELLSKAVLSEADAQFAGVFDGQSSSDAVKTLVKNADFVLALGVWLTDINSLGWDQDYDKTAFVSLDAVKFGTYFSAEVALEHLIDGLLASGVSCKSQTLPPHPPYAAPDFAADEKITYQGFYDMIAGYVEKNTIIGSDASMNYFGSLLVKVPLARGFIAQSSYSAIGYIGPAATGVCFAKEKDQRVMFFSGDGGFQMSAQCLSTQTRFGLNPIIFVIDNGVYGVEQWLGDASVYHSDKPFYKSCNLHRWNYSKLADVFGCQGWKVETYGQLEDALTEAFENFESPSIIQVVVPAKSIPDNAAWKRN